MDSEPQTRIIKFTPSFSVQIEDQFEGKASDRSQDFEAEILNQARADLIKKRFLKYVKAMDTMGKLEFFGASDMRDVITEFSKTYRFGDHSKKAATEARKLAKVHVVSGIRAAGYVLNQVTKGNLADMIDKVLRDNDRYVEEARELVPIGEQLAPLEYTGESADDF